MSVDDAMCRGELAALVKSTLNKPDMIAEVLAEHTQDEQGECVDCSYCVDCGGYQGVIWPCEYSLCAAQAKAVRDSLPGGPARVRVS